jgi:dTDP-4-amino-4,6-dideoxygalactose transaminase
VNLVPLNDLARQSRQDSNFVLDLVREVVDRGNFLRGPVTARFEEALSAYLGVKHAVGVANGTDALYLALKAVGVGEGDVVATVANAGGYATGATFRAGATPLFIDVNLSDAQMSPIDLEKWLSQTDRVQAVVLTHLFGLMGDVKEIRSICDRHKVPLVEDCAQAIGAARNGVKAGAWGDVATFSFYPTKNLGCFGDGGAVVSDREDIAERVRRLAQYGWSERYFVDTNGGINSRLDEIQAAILMYRLARIDDENRSRRSIALKFAAAMSGTRRILTADDDSFVAHLCVMVSESRSADAASLESAGVQSGIHYPELDYNQVAWRSSVDATPRPNSKHFVDRILTIPCFPTMRQDEIEQVESSLRALPA